MLSPLQEAGLSPISMDGGESLKTAGDMGGEWGLADVLQALQLPDENPGK